MSNLVAIRNELIAHWKTLSIDVVGTVAPVIALEDSDLQPKFFCWMDSGASFTPQSRTGHSLVADLIFKLGAYQLIADPAETDDVATKLLERCEYLIENTLQYETPITIAHCIGANISEAFDVTKVRELTQLSMTMDFVVQQRVVATYVKPPPDAVVVYVATSVHNHVTTEPEVNSALLVPENSVHPHVTTEPVVIVGVIVFAEDSVHSHITTEPAIVGGAVVTPEDSVHVHVTTEPTLTGGAIVTPEDSVQPHVTTEPTITLGGATTPPVLEKAMQLLLYEQSPKLSGRVIDEREGVGDWVAVPKRAYEFEGAMVLDSGGRATTGANTRLGICGFMKPTVGWVSNRGLMNESSVSGQIMWRITNLNGVPYFQFSQDGVNFTARLGNGSEFQFDKWQHFFLDFQGGKVDWYFDGKLAITDGTDTGAAIFDGTSPLVIGAQGATVQPYEGFLSDVRIYQGDTDVNDALTNLGGITAGAYVGSPRAMYKMNDFNTTAWDSSGNDIHLTKANAGPNAHYIGTDVPTDWSNRSGYTDEITDHIPKDESTIDRDVQDNPLDFVGPGRADAQAIGAYGLYFTGATTPVVCSNSGLVGPPQGGNISLGLFFTNESTGTRYLVSKGSNFNSSRVLITCNNASVGCKVGLGATVDYSHGGTLVNRLTHYGFTIEGTVVKIYIDGVLVLTGASDPIDPPLSDRDWQFGSYSSGPVTGQVVDFEVFNNAVLTDQQMLYLATAGEEGTAPPSPDILIPCNDNSGVTVLDYSGNDYHGTITDGVPENWGNTQDVYHWSLSMTGGAYWINTESTIVTAIGNWSGSPLIADRQFDRADNTNGGRMDRITTYNQILVDAELDEANAFTADLN